MRERDRGSGVGEQKAGRGGETGNGEIQNPQCSPPVLQHSSTPIIFEI